MQKARPDSWIVELFNSMEQGASIIHVLFDEQRRAYDYRFVSVNPAFSHQIGIVQATEEWTSEADAAYKAAWLAQCGAVISSGQPVHFEHHEAHTERIYDVHMFRLGEPAAHHIGCIVSDVSELRGARHATSESEQRIQLLIQQERAALDAAEQAQRQNDEFLITISHELRTPLTALLGFAHLLQTRKHNETQTAMIIDKLVRSAQEQARLIHDLLDVSHTVSGYGQFLMKLVDFVDVVCTALASLQPVFEAKHLLVHANLEPAKILVVGDAFRLQQLVWHLLSNAAKFTPAEGEIYIQCEVANNDIQLVVADTGNGITADFLPHVFDRFRRADNTNTRVSGGLGVGLSIVRYVAEMHGGTVQAFSAGEGLGAAFTVRLPLPAGAPMPIEHAGSLHSV